MLTAREPKTRGLERKPCIRRRANAKHVHDIEREWWKGEENYTHDPQTQEPMNARFLNFV